MHTTEFIRYAAPSCTGHNNMLFRGLIFLIENVKIRSTHIVNGDMSLDFI